jgi:hypothetical protein
MNNQHHHPPTTRSSSTALNDLNEYMKKISSTRRQTTRSTSNSNKDHLTSTNIQVIKPVAVRPPSTDATQNPYNLRSRTKLKTSNHTNEVLPSFTEKLSLETPQSKPVPPLTRAAAASAGVKIDLFITDDSIKTSSSNNNNNKPLINSQQSTRSSTTRKRKASEDDHRPYLDLLKMKQVIILTFSFPLLTIIEYSNKIFHIRIMINCIISILTFHVLRYSNCFKSFVIFCYFLL